MKLNRLTIYPAQTEVHLPEGSRLTELEYETDGRPIPFGCRSGACGACIVEVLEGSTSLGEPDGEELDFLEDLGRADGDYRLACQCRLQGDATVRPASED